MKYSYVIPCYDSENMIKDEGNDIFTVRDGIKRHNYSMEQKIGNKKILWINNAKAVAIIAVLVNHCAFFLYPNSNITILTYFSVALFVTISGMTTYLSYMKNNNKDRVVKGLSKIVAAYEVNPII